MKRNQYIGRRSSRPTIESKEQWKARRIDPTPEPDGLTMEQRDRLLIWRAYWSRGLRYDDIADCYRAATSCAWPAPNRHTSGDIERFVPRDRDPFEGVHLPTPQQLSVALRDTDDENEFEVRCLRRGMGDRLPRRYGP